ncbi:neutral ceramidase [Xyrichtys novacula]|uniref:Neutral ceramidase n=1 Tax=Xyrichtys novacula TaxID=13765 RepID=A0AAV1HAU3_XYRNO|nr:neutral ceramidase [Xyrichtys novacula]
MRRFIVLLALLCVCDGVRFGPLCSGNPNNRRRTSDSWGAGNYGARRGSRTHQGLDIVCEDGSEVYAPFDVTLNGKLIVYNDPTKAAINSGINLSGEGLCFKLFYVRPDRTSGTVRKGQRIGVMLPMQSVYPGITSHVHVQLCNKKDPTQQITAELSSECRTRLHTNTPSLQAPNPRVKVHAMANRKSVCCGLSSLEVTLAVLFVLMTATSVSLITLMALQTKTEPTPLPTTEPRTPYLIGVGRADCTGPPAEVPLMGYANSQQNAAGIHTRLFSRAFIIDDGRRRVVFVTADVGMISQRLRLEVLQALQVKYGDLYGQENVVLSGTHTHCGLGGYFQYTLFMMSTKGYIRASVEPLVNGIVKSIDIAHSNMRPGRIYRARGELDHSSLNRSPHSYMNNPEDERQRYKTNTDKQVVVLKFTDLDGDGIGMLSWFAVHAVSMNFTNLMVSSDNMGYASYLLEQDKNPGELPGQGGFVAGFSSSNLGDVSPNTKGPHCLNTGLPCDYLNSSCPVGGPRMCTSFGPGEDMFDSTRIIGENIYKKAKELYAGATEEVTGFLHSAHQWVNMTDVTIPINATHTVRTCKPALGHSFAAGTTDGGGDLNFTQGAVEGDPFWDGIRDALLGEPSNETQECHHPKPILFSTGEMNWPLPWHPQIVDVQIITIGSVAVVAVPGEMTTMSGRRLREAVRQELQSEGGFSDVEVVIAGLSNIYTHYITTFEEYQVQRYEGASTIYGPHTLSAYLQKYRGLAKAIAQVRLEELQGP